MYSFTLNTLFNKLEHILSAHTVHVSRDRLRYQRTRDFIKNSPFFIKNRSCQVQLNSCQKDLGTCQKSHTDTFKSTRIPTKRPKRLLKTKNSLVLKRTKNHERKVFKKSSCHLPNDGGWCWPYIGTSAYGHEGQRGWQKLEIDGKSRYQRVRVKVSRYQRVRFFLLKNINFLEFCEPMKLQFVPLLSDAEVSLHCSSWPSTTGLG